MTGDRSNPLDPLAGSAVPEMDAATRDRLEAGLRVQHASRHPAPGGRRIPRRVVVGPVVALVLIVATIVFVARDESAVAALEVRDAVNVTITLPGGDVVTDPADGFALTDGALVVVGADGRVTIDDVTLGAGTTVTVRDGRLVSDVVATTTIDRPERTDRPADVDDRDTEPDRPPGEVTTTTTTASAPPRPTEAPVDTTPVRPTPTDAPPPEPTRPPADPAPTDRPGEVDPGTDVAVALRVDRRDGGVRVTWNAEGVADTGWRVVVVRTIDGSEPLRAGDGTVIGEGERGEVTDERRDLPGDVETLRYRVIILDDGDGVVARSAVQTLMLD